MNFTDELAQSLKSDAQPLAKRANLAQVTTCTVFAIIYTVISVLARLGKGQGAKEIVYNLARERSKFGHNPAHANETRSGHNFVGDR